MSAETKEIVDAFAAALKDIRDDAEWRGRMSAMMETVVKNMEELKSCQGRNDDRVSAKLTLFDETMTRLRIKVAAWSAIYASAATILMWVVMKIVFKV